MNWSAGTRSSTGPTSSIAPITGSLGQNAIEFHIATNVVLETGFTNLQCVGLASLARGAGDYLFEKMIISIQTDEARHAEIGHLVLALAMKHDPEYARYLIDKWFWRNWHLFSILTGVTMDHLTNAAQPWYWNIFLDEPEDHLPGRILYSLGEDFRPLRLSPHFSKICPEGLVCHLSTISDRPFAPSAPIICGRWS